MRNLLILIGYGVVFLTGAAGLIYQVVWQKYVSRLLGADSIATAIILGSFLGGLSLGYYLCGRFSTHLKNHLRAFALLEGAIGIWCFIFPWIFSAVNSLTRSWSFDAPFLIMLQGFLCAVLLMGIPTICMGGTVPLITRGISLSLKDATHVHAMIYSINTAGAVIGALLAGFYLIPVFGLPVTITRTAFINIGACLIFLAISTQVRPRFSDESFSKVSDSSHAVQSGRFSPSMLYVIAFLSGFYVMTLENVFIRVVNFSLGSSSYSFSLVIAVFILAIAIGSYLVGRASVISETLLYWNQMTIAGSLFLVYFSIDTWPYWAHVIRIGFQSNSYGFWQYYIHVFLVLALVLLIPVAAMGATIPITFHELKRNLNTVGRDSGLLLSWNTMGNLVGSLVGGILFYYFLNNERIFLSAMLLAAGSVCAVGWFIKRPYFIGGVAVFALSTICLVLAPFYDQHHFVYGTFRHREPLAYSGKGPDEFFKHLTRNIDVLFFDDDPIATVSVADFEQDRQNAFNRKSKAIMVNGKSDSSTVMDIYTLKLLAHLPALFAAKRSRALVIGLGTGVTAGELTLYPDVDRIDVAEISPAVIEALPLFQDATHQVHKNPKVRMFNGDAFRILGRSRDKWDIIISEPSNPWVMGVDLLFTQEFYRMVRDHLSDDGILLQWIQQYATSREMIGMILNTIRQEFPHARVFLSNLNDLLLLASSAPLDQTDVARAEAELLRNDRVRRSLAEIDLDSMDSLLIREVWTPTFVKNASESYGLQTMDHPRLHYLAGKDFFYGKEMGSTYLLNTETVPLTSEYLLVQKYPDWNAHFFTEQEFDKIMFSLKDHVDGKMLPMARSLGLKMVLARPEAVNLSQDQADALGLYMLSFIIEPGKTRRDWTRIGLDQATVREKAEKLLQYVRGSRNWIVPYPLEGLMSLLQQGIDLTGNPYDRTWCGLQLSMLIINEEANVQEARRVMERVKQLNAGKLMVADSDRRLFEVVSRKLR